MLFVPEDLAYTLRVRGPQRPDSATVEVRSGRGAEIVAALTSATVSTVSTVLSAAAGAGDELLLVTVATSIARGDELRLGPNAGGQSEWVGVEAISGGSLVLSFPLTYDHASGVALQGTYMSYALTATHTATRGPNCRAIFSPTIGGVIQAPIIVRFDIVRHWVGTNPCTRNDVRVHDARALDRLPPGYDVDAGLDRAFQEVLRDLNGARRIGRALADDDWREVVAMKFLASYVGQAMGARGEGYRKRWGERYEERVEILESQTVVDADEDGKITPEEEGIYGGRAYRG